MAEDQDYKKLYEDEKKKVQLLDEKLSSYERKGNATLYYALNRNMNDIAQMLNKTNLKDANLDDPKDKTMERMKIIWSAISPLVETLKVLKDSAGITGDEDKDTTRRPFIETIAEKRPY